MDLGIKGKTALVLASSRGLGFGVARALSLEGVRVVICSRNSDEAQQSASRIEKESGYHVLPAQCDVTVKSDIKTLVSICRETFGDPDILVTNAGGPPPGKPLEFSEKDYSMAFERNFLSAVTTIKSVLPGMMKKKWGRIILITSAAVKQPVQHLILSNTARSALTAYAKTLATDLASTGITVNTVLPGIHQTSRIEALIESISEAEGRPVDAVRDEWCSGVPMKRLGTVDEFGGLVTFLCSTGAAFITGQAIVHDGGATKGLL